MSPESARRAEKLGYTNAKVFHEGMPAWKKSGNAILSEPASLKDYIEKDIAHVLVDIRPAAEARKGFIRGAVSVPAAGLAGAKDKFPSDKSAPIIIYTSDSSSDAYKTVAGWGYKNVSVLNGGVEGWLKSGGKLVEGEPTTNISYVPKPRPGEVSIEEFKAIAEKGQQGVIILDVRDSDEAMNGMIKGAINIPAADIIARIAEVPKDKTIITHCTTGIRAESAYDDLKEKGYNVKFLNAVIQIDKDGKYEITKK